MNNYLAYISSVCEQYPQQLTNILNSINLNQYKSKSWLVEKLSEWVLDESPTILIVGGWYGSYLIPMLKERYPDSKIIHTDKDPRTVEIASKLHSNNTNCTFEVLDTHNPTKQYTADILINTSCEHMEKLGMGILSNKYNCLYALQSCDNKNDPGHINTSINTKDFSQKCNLTTELFAARMDLGHKNRFMVIGYR